jgi:basic membrane lipoprotein Med (substrate-binding protein (PBP1-ABC) superfamily)
MTSWVVHPLVRSPRAARRAAPAVVASLVGAVVALAALASVLAPAPRSVGAARTALVVDAGGRPHAALERARSAAGPNVAVRVPRTGSEAAVDLRYFGAAGYSRVVAVGPAARTAVRAVAARYPRTRFVVR